MRLVIPSLFLAVLIGCASKPSEPLVAPAGMKTVMLHVAGMT